MKIDQRTQDAMKAIQDRTGYRVASEKRNKPQHTPRATNGTKPRSQKGRKYSAAAEAKRAAWRRSKGFKTRKERLEGLPDAHTSALEACSSLPTAEVNPTGYPTPATSINPSTQGLGNQLPWASMPRPTLQPATPSVDMTLTRQQAQDRGYAVQYLSAVGVYQYRAASDKYWTSCANPTVAAKQVGIEIRRPLISDLYSRSQPTGLDHRCDHAKRGMPPDGSCTGNCDGKFTPNE